MKIKKILVILAVVLLGVSLAACQREQAATSSSTKFVYYTMPSVLNAGAHLDEATNGISGIAVDPKTRCEYYFSGTHGIHPNNRYSKAKLSMKPRYDSNRKIVKYNGDLSALHHLRFNYYSNLKIVKSK